MARKTTPSFIHELPLVIQPNQEKILLVRLDQARQLYNACLCESLRRLDLMRQSKSWQQARKSRVKKERKSLFKQARDLYRFNEYDLHAFAGKTKNTCSIKTHLDINTCQKIATRAFKAVESYMFGLRGRPRFKGFNRLLSVEGKNNASGIRWKDDQIVWSKLKLQPIFDLIDKKGVQAHALQSRTKYVRIVRRQIKGRNRFYAQLVLEGQPLPHKTMAESGVVGLDLGPSTLAAVSDDTAFLKGFCEELEPLGREKQILQRRLDRSRRLTNPQCFNDDGTWKKGERFIPSNRYLKDKARLSELERRIAGYRKTLHGQLANKIFAMGNEIHLEDVSYKSWQKIFGKSISNKAPGMFVEMLCRKAESAGGKVIKTPLKLALSQTCHCGEKQKKSLNERWHKCQCGAVAQRDLYSAFLARFADESTLDISQAQTAWAGAEPFLNQAISRINQTAKGKLRLSSFGLGKIPRQSCSLDTSNGKSNEDRDVVPDAKAKGRALENCFL